MSTEITTAEMPDDFDLSSFRDLPEAAPAPKKKAGSVHADLQRKLLPIILDQVLTQGRPVSRDQIAEIAGVDPWGVGVVTGEGINNRNGLKLWKDRGAIVPCYQNAKRVIDRMTKEEIADFCTSHGMTSKQLIAAVVALPRVQE